MVQRDLRLLNTLTAGSIWPICSTAGAVQNGAGSQAERVAGYGFGFRNEPYFDDAAAVNTFDAAYKLMPPLVGREDLEALKQVLDGTIDAISANHVPLDEEEKEFSYAEFGATGLEVFCGCL